MQTPNPGELWHYRHVDGKDIEEQVVIVIDKVVTSHFLVQKFVQFSYIDTWEEDEMSWSTFQTFCERINNGV